MTWSCHLNLVSTSNIELNTSLTCTWIQKLINVTLQECSWVFSPASCSVSKVSGRLANSCTMRRPPNTISDYENPGTRLLVSESKTDGYHAEGVLHIIPGIVPNMFLERQLIQQIQPITAKQITPKQLAVPGLDTATETGMQWRARLSIKISRLSSSHCLAAADQLLLQHVLGLRPIQKLSTKSLWWCLLQTAITTLTSLSASASYQ